MWYNAEKRCDGGGRWGMTHKVLKDGIMEQQRREGGGRGMFHIPYILVYKSNFLDVKMGSKNRPRHIFGRT